MVHHLSYHDVVCEDHQDPSAFLFKTKKKEGSPPPHLSPTTRLKITWGCSVILYSKLIIVWPEDDYDDDVEDDYNDDLLSPFSDCFRDSLFFDWISWRRKRMRQKRRYWWLWRMVIIMEKVNEEKLKMLWVDDHRLSASESSSWLLIGFQERLTLLYLYHPLVLLNWWSS